MVRQSFTGLVVSQGKMNKTVKVRVKRLKYNKLVKKDIIHFKDFLVHDEANKCTQGDVVRIEYVRPLSARKSFAVTDILVNKGQEWLKYKLDAPAKVATEELAKLDAHVAEAKKRQAEFAFGEIGELRKGLGQDGKLAHKVALDVSSLAEEISRIQMAIEQDPQTLARKVADADSSSASVTNEIIKSLGKNPDGMSNSIKKNILRRHFAKQL